jgi:primase-polymerase (primpol)-like protein
VKSNIQGPSIQATLTDSSDQDSQTASRASPLPIAPTQQPPVRATPASIQTIRANVPRELVDLPRWVAWDGTRKPDGKLDKTPRNPHTGGKAQTNNPSTWAAFEVAAEFALRDERCGGLGLVLTDSDYWALDLDHIIDTATGELAAAAAALLRDLPPTYMERSPSGDGIHVIFRGKRPDALSRTRAKDAFGADKHLEVFGGGSSRYLTMTGQVWEGP